MILIKNQNDFIDIFCNSMYYYPYSKKQFILYVHTIINNKHQRRVRTVLKKPEEPLMLCTVKLHFILKKIVE